MADRNIEAQILVEFDQQLADIRSRIRLTNLDLDDNEREHAELEAKKESHYRTFTALEKERARAVESLQKNSFVRQSRGEQ